MGPDARGTAQGSDVTGATAAGEGAAAIKTRPAPSSPFHRQQTAAYAARKLQSAMGRYALLHKAGGWPIWSPIWYTGGGPVCLTQPGPRRRCIAPVQTPPGLPNAQGGGKGKGPERVLAPLGTGRPDYTSTLLNVQYLLSFAAPARPCEP